MPAISSASLLARSEISEGFFARARASSSYSDQVRAQHNMRQKQSFGYASYSPSLAQFLDIFEPTKRRAFDAGNAQGGVGLQDGVARATGFGDAPSHRQARHQYSLRARKIRLALDGARGAGQSFLITPSK